MINNGIAGVGFSEEWNFFEPKKYSRLPLKSGRNHKKAPEAALPGLCFFMRRA
jgi:hypothetical protein